MGSPPSCRPECSISAECPLNEACSNQRCINPCKGSCGVNAECKVVNHNPICTCPVFYSGDPFSRCFRLRKYWWWWLYYLFYTYRIDQKRNVFIWLLIWLNFFSWKLANTRESMHTITVWAELYLSWSKWSTNLHLPRRLPRPTTLLQTRMYQQRRVFNALILYQHEM